MRLLKDWRPTSVAFPILGNPKGNTCFLQKLNVLALTYLFAYFIFFNFLASAHLFSFSFCSFFFSATMATRLGEGSLNSSQFPFLFSKLHTTMSILSSIGPCTGIFSLM